MWCLFFFQTNLQLRICSSAFSTAFFLALHEEFHKIILRHGVPSLNGLLQGQSVFFLLLRPAFWVWLFHARTFEEQCIITNFIIMPVFWLPIFLKLQQFCLPCLPICWFLSTVESLFLHIDCFGFCLSGIPV